MSGCFFQSDSRYRRFLAERPGLWFEVGAFDDLMFLSALRAERQALGLPLTLGVSAATALDKSGCKLRQGTLMS